MLGERHSKLGAGALRECCKVLKAPVWNFDVDVCGQVDLCGHATLASAHALRTMGVVPPTQSLLRFRSKSGILTAALDGK